MVSITDDDVPQVKVSFAQASYTAAEGGTVEVTVTLDADPERTVVVPITHTPQDGADSSDYSGAPANVTFVSGDTSEDFTITLADDTVDDDDESVLLGFGTLPDRVSEGTTAEATLSITDDDLAGDRLVSLVVAPRDIDGFDPKVTKYMVGVASTVSQATITATPAQPDSTVAINGASVTAGSAHAVDLSVGLNTFLVVVTSADNDQTTYTVHIGRGTTEQGGWKAGDDLDTLRSAGNTEPNGIWSNGTTIWISDVSNAKLYAYSQAGGARDAGKDIALNGVILAPTGIWSDGTTIWVIGPVEETVFAYTLSSSAELRAAISASAVTSCCPWICGPMASPCGSSTRMATSCTPTPFPVARAPRVKTSTWPAKTLRPAASGPTGLPFGSLISTTASSTLTTSQANGLRATTLICTHATLTLAPSGETATPSG